MWKAQLHFQPEFPPHFLFLTAAWYRIGQLDNPAPENPRWHLLRRWQRRDHDNRFQDHVAVDKIQGLELDRKIR